MPSPRVSHQPAMSPLERIPVPLPIGAAASPPAQTQGFCCTPSIWTSQRFSTDVQSKKKLKTTQRQKAELLIVEHKVKCSITQVVALPPCSTPRAPLQVKNRISTRTAQIRLCVTLNLSPAYVCRSGRSYSPCRASPAPCTPWQSPAPVPALATGTECRKMRWLCVHRGTNLISIDFVSLLKGKTLYIETNQEDSNDK